GAEAAERLHGHESPSGVVADDPGPLSRAHERGEQVVLQRDTLARAGAREDLYAADPVRRGSGDEERLAVGAELGDVQRALREEVLRPVTRGPAADDQQAEVPAEPDDEVRERIRLDEAREALVEALQLPALLRGQLRLVDGETALLVTLVPPDRRVRDPRLDPGRSGGGAVQQLHGPGVGLDGQVRDVCARPDGR